MSGRSHVECRDSGCSRFWFWMQKPPTQSRSSSAKGIFLLGAKQDRTPSRGGSGGTACPFTHLEACPVRPAPPGARGPLGKCWTGVLTWAWAAGPTPRPRLQPPAGSSSAGAGSAGVGAASRLPPLPLWHPSSSEATAQGSICCFRETATRRAGGSSFRMKSAPAGSLTPSSCPLRCRIPSRVSPPEPHVFHTDSNSAWPLPGHSPPLHRPPARTGSGRKWRLAASFGPSPSRAPRADPARPGPRSPHLGAERTSA